MYIYIYIPIVTTYIYIYVYMYLYIYMTRNNIAYQVCCKADSLSFFIPRGIAPRPPGRGLKYTKIY